MATANIGSCIIKGGQQRKNRPPQKRGSTVNTVFNMLQERYSLLSLFVIIAVIIALLCVFEFP